MLESIKDQSDCYIKLQMTELDIASLESEISQVPEKIESLKNALEQCLEKMTEQEESIKNYKKKYRDFESDVQMKISRKKNNEVKLLSVKTNREYHALLAENEDILKKNSDVEDRMIEILDIIEDAEKQRDSKNSEYLILKRKTHEEVNELISRKKSLQNRLDILHEDYNNLLKSISRNTLDIYYSVKKLVGKIVIVPVQNAVCDGCKMKIPPQMFNDMHRSDEIKYCPHCQRMIYLKNN